MAQYNLRRDFILKAIYFEVYDLDPDVSVVMAVYKSVDNVSVTLASVLAQQDVNLEVVLVDDGNSDEDRLMIEDIAKEDDRIRVINNPTNVGLTKSLVEGCRHALAPYIARIDNGDLMVPENRLALQKNVLDRREDIAIVGGWYEAVDLLNCLRFRDPLVELSHEQIIELPRWKSKFRHVSVMFRANSYFKCGGYNPDYRYGQDNELWPRLLETGEGVVLPRVFAVTPMHPDSISVSKNNQQIKSKIVKIYKNRYEVGYFLSIRSILLEIIKIMMPVRVRVAMRYLKNMDYVGRVPKNCRNGLKNLETFYREENV